MMNKDVFDVVSSPHNPKHISSVVGLIITPSAQPHHWHVRGQGWQRGFCFDASHSLVN